MRATYGSCPFWGGRPQSAQTLSLLRTPSLSTLWVSRYSRRVACSFTKSGSEAGAGVGNFNDTGSALLPQDLGLVFSSSFAQRELSESCSRVGTVEIFLSSGEARSGFPANFFSKKTPVSVPRTSQRRGRLLFLPTMFHWFRSNTSGDLAAVLVFVWTFYAKTAQLTVNDRESS